METIKDLEKEIALPMARLFCKEEDKKGRKKYGVTN